MRVSGTRPRNKAKCHTGICGHFGGTKSFFDGQTIKTKSVTAELEKRLGKDEILIVDTYGGAKALPRCLWGLLRLLRHCKHVIILPAHNSVKIFPLFLMALNHVYHRRLHYIVIGGWLPEFLSSRQWVAKTLKRFDGIYVETSAMKAALEDAGFTNIILMPNFKDLNILRPEELCYQTEPPFKLCTFSRVMKEKGIEDAIEAVKAVNSGAGQVLYTLDIYGQIEKDYAEAFAKLQKSFPPCIKYGGTVPFDQSVEVLKDYFALLFPTHFYTEGIPGTIIDAYAAGLPVISSKWENFGDIIDDGTTGIGFPLDVPEELSMILSDIAQYPQKILKMKVACINKALDFTPEIALITLCRKLL